MCPQYMSEIIREGWKLGKCQPFMYNITDHYIYPSKSDFTKTLVAKWPTVISNWGNATFHCIYIVLLTACQ